MKLLTIKSGIRFLLATLTVMFTAAAASADNTSKEINDIKRASERYIYAESTMPTEKEARLNADNLLVSTINSLFEETGENRSFTPDMARRFQYMKMKRGNDIRVLVYIDKEDIGLSQAVLSADRKPENPLSVHAAASPVNTPPSASPTATSTSRLTEPQQQTVRDLLEAADMQAAMKLLSMFQAMHKIRRYGTVDDAPSGPEAPYWIIGTPDFAVSTIITGGESPRDIVSGHPDRAENHTGVPKLWFTLR